jgi:hypothetical protein
MLFAVYWHRGGIRLRSDHPHMNKTTGHIIRMIGMLIEMFGVWGVYQASNTKSPWLISIPGAGTMPVAWLAVFAGLIIWLAGVFIVYSYKPTRWRKEDSSDELAP